MKITIREIEIDFGGHDGSVAALLDQTKQLNRIIAQAIVSGKELGAVLPPAPTRIVDVQPIPDQPAYEPEPDPVIEPVDFGRVERTLTNGMRHVSAIEARNDHPAEIPAPVEKKTRKGWTPERRAKQAEHMKNVISRRIAEGRHPAKKKATTDTAPEVEPKRAKAPDAVPVSREALSLIGGSAAKALAERDDVNVDGDDDLDDEERAELERPLPTPEEIFGRNVLTEAKFGERTIEQVRRAMESTPGPAGRLAR